MTLGRYRHQTSARASEDSGEWQHITTHRPSCPQQPGSEPGSNSPQATVVARQGSWVRTRTDAVDTGTPGLLSGPLNPSPHSGSPGATQENGVGTGVPGQVLHSEEKRPLFKWL